MKRIALVIITALGTVALPARQLAPGNPAGTTATKSTASSPVAHAENTAAPVSNAGYVVHFDDKGNIVAETAPQSDAEFNAQLNEFINTSQEGLVQTVNPVPGGGTKLDLQGRFQSAATATVDKNGNVAVPCLTNEADVRAFSSATAADRAAKKK